MSSKTRSGFAAAQSRQNRKAFVLLLPALIFLAATFLLPIARMALVSVYDPTLPELLPQMVESIPKDRALSLDDKKVWLSLATDLSAASKADTIGIIANRLNTEQPGMRSIVQRTARRIEEIDTSAPGRWFAMVDPAWGRANTFSLLQRASHSFTIANYLGALDLRTNSAGEIEQEADRIHRALFLKTFWVAGVVTLLCAILGFPIAYLMVTTSKKTSGRLMVLVLVPFWTSMLVRTTAWIVILQSNGVLNDALVEMGVIKDAERVMLVYNMTGTLIAMTHILLPFFVLPLYSVMTSIPDSYMRAAQSLGAGRFYSFWKVYFPNTLPGVAAGALLVLILALGYYITPALVGGQSGQMISNQIAFNIQSSLNWGLASALGMVLLFIVLALYLVYNRLVGVEHLRLS